MGRRERSAAELEAELKEKYVKREKKSAKKKEDED